MLTTFSGPFLILVESDIECAIEIQEGLTKGGITWPVCHLHSINAARQMLRPENDLAFLSRRTPEAIVIGFGDDAQEELEFTRWIRNDPIFRDVVVIGLGKRIASDEVQDAYASGLNAYFLKGSGIESLARTLKAMQELKPSSTELLRRDAGEKKAEVMAATPRPVWVITEFAEEAEKLKTSLGMLGLVNPPRWASSVKDAKELFQEAEIIGEIACKPVVVFLDLQLPESLSLLAWLEKHPEMRPPGLIVTTKTHDMRLVIQAYHLGVNSFIRTPPKLEDLKNALSAIHGVRPMEAGGRRWLQ